MFWEFVRNISNGAHLYWNRRITTHPIRWVVLLVAFCAMEVLLVATVSSEFALAWFAIGVSFLVGDITTLIKVARCRNCGFVVAPAPTYRKACPSCGHIMQP
jgi:hypothetical protein